MKKLMAMCGAVLVCAGCTSFEDVKQKADAGDAGMQYKVAVMYRDGDGVAADRKKSEEYLKKAIDSGNRAAAWDRLQQICSKKQLDASAEFIKCCNVIFDQTAVNISSDEKDARNEAAISIPRVGLAYLRLLAENKCDSEAYEVKACLRKIVSETNGYRRKFVWKFLQELNGVKTARELAEAQRVKAAKEAEAKRIKAEKEAEAQRIKAAKEAEAKRIVEEKKQAEEQKRQAEEKAKKERLAKLNDPKFKYPCGKPGVRLYKDVCAGTSAQYIDELQSLKNIGYGATWETCFISHIKIINGCVIDLLDSAVEMKDVVAKYQMEFPGIRLSEKKRDKISLENDSAIIIVQNLFREEFYPNLGRTELRRVGVRVSISDKKYKALSEQEKERERQKNAKKQLNF